MGGVPLGEVCEWKSARGVKNLKHFKRPNNQGEKNRQIRRATWDTVLQAGRSAARRTDSDTGTRPGAPG